MLCMLNILFLVVYSEDVPVKFDQVTKQAYHSPPAAAEKKGVVINIVQHVSEYSIIQRKKWKETGFNINFLSGMPSMNFIARDGKIHQTEKQKHHQVNMRIDISADCARDQACMESTLQTANNAYHGGSQQKRVN